MITKQGMLRHAVLVSLPLALAACGGQAKLNVAEGMGADPKLPPPDKSLIPTLQIAPATGWASGDRPITAEGTAVAPFADGLDHPRWLYVLPNGDVLVAETNGPPRPEDNKGIKALLQEARHGEGRSGTAERQSHHAAARHERRRRGRPALGLPDGSQLALRHGAGAQRSLRRQHGRAAAFSVLARSNADHCARA